MTEAELQARLALYLEAESAILISQSYSVGTRQLTRANLKEVQDEISRIRHELAAIRQDGGFAFSTTIFGGRR